MMNIVKKLLGVSVFFSLFSCSSNNSGTGNASQTDSYSTLKVEPYDVTLYREFPATLRGEQVVVILPKVDGYIQHIYVKEGEKVKKGQLMFEIFNPSYKQNIASIKASIKSAEADLATAKIDYENTKALVERQVVGNFQLKTEKNAVETKEQEVKELEADLATQQTNLQYTRITAPANGYVSTIPYKVGALVSSSSTEGLTTLSNSTTILAYFSVSETDLLKYNDSIGTEACLILPNDSVYAFKGTINRASNTVSTETGSLTYSAVFSNPKGFLKSGGFATVKIPYQMKQVLVIPQSATYEIQDKKFVFVVNDKKVINSRMVEVTATSDGQYYIVNSGIKSGEEIVLDGVGLTLQDNMKIKPSEANKDSIFSKILSKE
jgi:membrane fusion protein, multidrug efflux system